MRVKDIIKVFRFEEDNRSRIVLGTNVRLNPEEHWVQLQEDDDGLYSTDADLYAKSWVFNPERVRRWTGFQAIVGHASIAGAVVTAMRYRLSDGTDDYWWDGGAWNNAPASGQWNTEEEICANISTFPVTEKKIQVIVNLQTTDETATPVLQEIRILYESDVEFLEDIVLRSLVPSLREELRPIGRYPFTLTATGTTVDLNNYPLKTPYNIVDVDSVFNHTDDPDHETDIFSSYNPGTKVITLTGSVDSGKVLWVNFIFEPEVTVTTSQYFEELSKVPVVILDDINIVRQSEVGPSEYVLNRDTYQGKKIVSPLRGDIEVTLRVATDKTVDLLRLCDEVKKFFKSNATIRSRGLDEEYRLWLTSGFDMGSGVPSEDIRSATLTFRVVDVLFFQESEVAYAVKKLHLTGDLSVVIEN